MRYGDKIPRAVQSAARAAFANTGTAVIKQAVRVARQNYTRGSVGSIPGASQLAASYRLGGVPGFARLAGGSGYMRTWYAIERYTKSGGAGRAAVQSFLRELGPIGSLLGAIVGHDSAGKASLPSDLRYALDLVKAFADQPSVLNALQRVLEGRGAQVVWPSGQGGSDAHLPRDTDAADMAKEIERAIEQAESGRGNRGSGGAGSGRGRGGGGRSGPPAGGGGLGDEGYGGTGDGKVAVNVDGQIERFPKDHPLVTGKMIETPRSSNVYAFGFDNQTHSLFVRFKDSPRKTEVAGFAIKGVFGPSGRGRPHQPGALYLYHNVPARLFLTFIDADSKGGWVWDHLRIRGTVSGHRHDYALVGVQGGYVPRKATLTPLGESYIPRTIFTDQGRSLSSSLPEQLVRPLRALYPGEGGGGGLGRPPNDGRGGLGGGRGGRRR